jgi:hypothetical protein
MRKAGRGLLKFGHCVDSEAERFFVGQLDLMGCGCCWICASRIAGDDGRSVHLSEAAKGNCRVRLRECVHCCAFSLSLLVAQLLAQSRIVPQDSFALCLIFLRT